MDIHKRFVQLGKQRHSLTRELCVLLPEIVKRQVYREYGFETIYEYAGKLAGLSRSVVEKALRLERHLVDKPALKKMLVTEGVHKVDLVARIATPENEPMWAKRVRDMSKAGLQQLVKEVKGTHREELRVALDEEAERLFLKLKKNLNGNLSNKEALKRLLKNLNERENEVCGKVEREKVERGQKVRLRKISPGRDSGKRSRYISVEIRRGAGEQCVYPDCKKPRECFHHRERYAVGGSHESVVALCEVHHEFAHNGLIKNERGKPDGWVLDLGGKSRGVDRKFLTIKKSAHS